MKTKIISFILFVGISFLLSCSNENEEVQNIQSSSLRITTDIATRSVIESTTFAPGDQIGIELLYGPTRNIRATYDNKWHLENSISLSVNPISVYAYYPYTKDFEYDMAKVDITPDAVVTGQADYLYGTSVKEVSATNPDAFIHFNHALARITLSIRRSADDIGSGLLSSVCLRNAGSNTAISTSGWMNISTGEIVSNEAMTGESSGEGFISLDVDYTLSSETAQNVDILVIPTEMKTEGMVELELTIDDSQYIVKMPAATWEAGGQYTYPITINRKGNSGSDQTNAKIGDYYYDDGTWSTQYNADKTCVGIVFALSEEQDGDINISLEESAHGRVVALHDLAINADYYTWGAADDIEYIPNFYTIDGEYTAGYLPMDGNESYSGEPHIQYSMYNWPIEEGIYYALTDYAGRKYTSYLNEFAGDYPAGNACSEYTTGKIGDHSWYLPAIGELARLAMACNAELLDRESVSGFETIKYPGYTYWSSSEAETGLEAWCYVAEFGQICAVMKTMSQKVRPITSF